MDELLLQLGDDDVRIRENAAKCLSRFIMQTNSEWGGSQKDSSNADAVAGDANNPTSVLDADANDVYFSTALPTSSSFHTNFKLVAEFIDYSIFQELPSAIRFALYGSLSLKPIPDDESKKKRCTLLAKILYRLTNQMMSLEDKHLQVK